MDYHDKYINRIGNNRHYPNLKNKKNTKISSSVLKKYDLVLVLTNHDYLNYKMIEKSSKLIIDTRNAINNSFNKNILKM